MAMLKTWRRTVASSFAGFLLLAGLALGQGDAQPAKNGAGQADKEHDQAPSAGNVSFSSRDLETIRVYFKTVMAKEPRSATGYNIAAPPSLPVERNAWLPPQIARRLKRFPRELEGRLPHLPDNYTRGTIDGDILIVDQRTRRVVDIVHNFLRL
jgi:hypothetical protein